VSRAVQTFLEIGQTSSRRRFLRFLAESPLFAAVAAAQENDWPAPASAKDAINVMDFEAAARKALPPAHFGYLASGVDDDATVRANRAGYQKIQLRPRRVVDVSGHADMRVELFGTTWETPIVLCPAGQQKAFNAEGEVAVARSARSHNTLQILSTATTSPIEDVAQAAGKIWFQLYPTSSWQVTEKLVRHAESAGCQALALTVDEVAGRSMETKERFRRMDKRDCSMCHSPEPLALGPMVMFKGIDMTGVSMLQPAITWEFVRKLKAFTRMKLVLKGIQTREDAQLCCENGVDGIMVSNHGGRAEETGRSTIECLPEVLDGVAGRIPVLVDGGIRRGTDIFKALAMGARAIGVGRPYLWGLSAFGQPGVDRVLDILRLELDHAMRQCGARSIAEIKRSAILVGQS
jgi:4-hydroxymandelate oxidase